MILNILFKLNRAYFWVKKELGTLILLIIAVVLCAILFPFGLAYSLIAKPIYHSVKGDPLYAGKKVLKYFGNFLYQIWNVIKQGFYFMGFILDLLGNVFVGELIEDIITPEENTMLGNGENTVSVAIGDLEVKAKKKPKKLNGRGWWLIRQLNRFEKNHANKAIRRWNFNQKLKKEE